MIWMALLGPGMISMLVKSKIEKKENKRVQDIIFEYGALSFFIILITHIVITYVFRIDGVTEDALQSFPFFIKYSIISCIIAIIIPFVQSVLKKIFEVSVSVGVYHEEKK